MNTTDRATYERKKRAEAKTVTQARLKELFSYDSDSGLFTRLVDSRFSKKGFIPKSNQTNGYIRIRIDNKYYHAHRLAFLYMTGEWPLHDVDHINRNRSDNRWENLRCATRRENARNNGFLGIYKQRGKWVASVTVSGKQKYLGVRHDFFEAMCLRKSAENEYYK